MWKVGRGRGCAKFGMDEAEEKQAVDGLEGWLHGVRRLWVRAH